MIQAYVQYYSRYALLSSPPYLGSERDGTITRVTHMTRGILRVSVFGDALIGERQ